MNKSIILWLTLLLATNVFPQTQTIDNKSSNDEQPPIATRSLPPWCGPSDNCYYLTRDYDNDGYGGFGNPRVESSQPSWPGYAPNASDCDDHNSNIHPGATEICSDGIDNNCNGRIDETKPLAPLILSIVKNCGKTIITRGSPPNNVTWYWQSSSSGTSKTNSSVSITRTSGTIYYLRGYNSSSGCWGPSNPISYSVNTVPGTPSLPKITKNCGSTVLTRGTPPSGITWYWQSSSSGTSTGNSSASITRSSGSVYYLRARNNTTGCWSSVRSVSYSINGAPGTPSAATVTKNCGSTVLTRGTPPNGITWYWQSSSSGTSTGNSSASITRTSGSVYYLRARNNTTGCWSSVRSVSYSINTVPGTPSLPTITKNCGSTVLTRGTPPSGITWYWQSSSSGTSTSNSSASITRTSGSVYYLRARNNTTGCWSSARSVSYSINGAPGTPSAATVINNCGSTVLTRGTPPSGITWYWQSSSSGTSTGNSSASITRTSGSVYYLRARNNTTGCWSSARSVSYSINAVPGTPSTATVTKNCGSTVLTRVTPPSGITWYWQSSSSGTSTSNSSASITRTSGSVYYLRARNNTTGCWSSARSVSYSINTVPGVPSTPTATNNCGGTVLTRVTPPSGITWYWQSSSSGTSTSNSSASITRTSGSVYYLRARNNITECWSSARSVSYSINAVPGVPSTPTITNNCGGTVLTRVTPPSGITWYWQSSSSGTSTSNSSASITLSSGSVYYLRARNNTTGCWSSARSVSYSINAVPGIPSTPNTTNNCGSTVLTRVTPPSGITWYWQSSSSGTSTSNSSASITLSSGSVYYLRARNNTTGCWSSARSVSYSINAVPDTPSTATVTKNCGSTVLTRETPPSGITWYWQSTSTGTSTSNASETISLDSGSEYYLRGQNDVSGCWGEAINISYTVNLEPEIPSLPEVNNECGSTVLTRGTPPSDITWYWQSTSTGTSTSNASETISLDSGSEYYLRGQNDVSGCWGEAINISYTVNLEPEIPSLPEVNNECGSTVLTRGTPPSGITWYWQSTSTGISTSNASETISLDSGSEYYLKGQNDVSGCWGEAISINYSIEGCAQPILINTVSMPESEYEIRYKDELIEGLISGHSSSETEVNIITEKDGIQEVFLKVLKEDDHNETNFKITVSDNMEINILVFAQGNWKTLSDEFYEIDENKIYFIPIESFSNSLFKANLIDGVVYDNSVPLEFKITRGIDLTGSELIIKSVEEESFTVVPETNENKYIWDGTNAQSGLYQFILIIQEAEFSGQFIIK